MTFSQHLSNEYKRILLHIVSMAVLAAFLFLTGTQPPVVFTILVVWLIALILLLLLAYRRLKNRLEELTAIMDGLDQKYLFMECVPASKDLYERHLHRLMRKAGKSMIESVSNTRAEQTEYREYIENWVHEIKVPITSAKLTCENNKTETSRKILYQLAQIDEHVERALYYARSGYIQNDFIIQATPLKDIVQEAIEKHRPLLIQNSVCIETDGLDCLVYTDGKWMTFILCQILSNAVKYRSEFPRISFTASSHKDRVHLCVTDNGLGIVAHELPRIFDKGFTGSNGRLRGEATGIGLYLVSKLSASLGIRLKADSAANAYTRITLDLPAKMPLTKM